MQTLRFMAKHYSANHIVISLTENWKNNLNNKIVGTVFKDLSRGFDCMSHDLLLTSPPVRTFLLIYIHTWSVEKIVKILEISTVRLKFYSKVTNKRPSSDHCSSTFFYMAYFFIRRTACKLCQWKSSKGFTRTEKW